MYKFILRPLLAAVLVSALFTSCKDENETGNEQSIEKTVAIFIPDNTVVARWADDKAGLESAMSTQNINYRFFMVKEDSIGAKEQASQIKQAIKEGYKTMIIVPVDYNVINSENTLADAADCNVICHDRLIMDNPNIDYFSTSDLEGVGKLQAECLIESFTGSGRQSMTLEMLAGPKADFNSEKFFDGAYTLLEPYITKGKMVVKSGRKSFDDVSIGQWNTTVARDTMMSILEAYYPDGQYPDLILAANDMCAEGSIKALEAHNPAISSYPAITGQDDEDYARQYIKAGKMTMTVNKSISAICTMTVGVAKAFLNGQTPVKRGSISNGAVDVSLVVAPVTAIYKQAIE